FSAPARPGNLPLGLPRNPVPLMPSGLRSNRQRLQCVYSAGRMVGSANEQPTVRETETVSAKPSFAGGLRRAAPDHRSFGRSAGRLVVWSYCGGFVADRKSTRLNSSHLGISYAVFCLKKK